MVRKIGLVSKDIDLTGEIGADITTHTNLTTGIHGVGANYVALAPAASHLVRAFTKGWTSEKLLKGAGVGANPTETALTWDLCEKFLFANLMLRRVDRVWFSKFDSYDMVFSSVSGSGEVTKQFWMPLVRTGNTSGSKAVLYGDAVFGWLNLERIAYFYAFATLSTTDAATGFVGMTQVAADHIPLATNLRHVGFILEKSAAVDKLYASNANGAAQTRTDLGITVVGVWRHLRIETDAAGVYFYVDNVLKATHTTNISTDALTWKMSIINNAAAANILAMEQPLYMA